MLKVKCHSRARQNGLGRSINHILHILGTDNTNEMSNISEKNISCVSYHLKIKKRKPIQTEIIGTYKQIAYVG